MCVYIHVCVDTYVCVYLCVCIRMCMCIHTCVCTRMFVCVGTSPYVRVRTWDKFEHAGSYIGRVHMCFRRGGTSL